MFARDADELLRYFRAEVNDAAAPYLWQDWECFGYMTEAFDALMKDANVVDKVLRLPVGAGQHLVPLPRGVTHIHAAHGYQDVPPVERWKLLPASCAPGSNIVVDDYGLHVLGTISAFFGREGQPTHYMRDYDAKGLRMSAARTEPYVIELQCSMTLGAPMESGAPLPTDDPQDLRLALHYMKYLAYMKQDAETEDLTRSRTAKALYDQGALDRESARRNYRRPAGVIRMAGW